MSWLRTIRLSRLQLAAVAVLSAGATALIIATAHGHTAAQTAALVALRDSPTVVQASGAPSRESSGVGTATSAPQSQAATPPPAAPPPAAAPAPAASPAPASSDGSGSGADADTGATGDDPGATTPTTTAQQPSAPPATKRSKVHHVFVIALSSPSFEDTFGHKSVAHYLNHALRPKGTLLGGYETLGPSELPDYLAMVGGQPPNADTQGNCSSYTEFPSSAKPDKAGIMSGTGCVYPNTVTTIGDQVTAAGDTWRAYIDDMGSTACAHPDSGSVDDTQLTGAGPQYDTRHNPFIYFHSLLDLGDCASDDLALAKLNGALRASAKKAPSYVFIAPGACEDTSDQQSCPDNTPPGLASEDAFLKQWVPRIMRSSAYRTDGALLIVFAHAAPSPTTTSSPGAQPKGPVPAGALVLSRYAAKGKTISAVYNPYSVLRSTEDLLGLKPLAKANSAKPFVADALPGA
jgi:phosphatidylinositol-3-phosphatase